LAALQHVLPLHLSELKTAAFDGLQDASDKYSDSLGMPFERPVQQWKDIRHALIGLNEWVYSGRLPGKNDAGNVGYHKEEKMFNYLAKSVGCGRAGRMSRPLARGSGFYGYRHVRV
jgi:hypothetical protein